MTNVTQSLEPPEGRIPNQRQPETTAPPGGRRNHGLKKDTLGVPSIFFYIIAAASPLTVVIALYPIIIGSGNGIGMPGAFVIAAVVLMIFAVGYVAMSKHVTNAGAFYAYVTLGLGRIPGLGSAFLAIFAYNAIQAGLYGGFGYYAGELFNAKFGTHLPWWLFAGVALVLCLGLGVQGVHSGARVLGVFMSLEITMITVLSVCSLFGGTVPVSQFSFEPFSPSVVLAGSLGVALMFAHASFIGFEGSAIYGEEAREPARTIPRATYLSIAFMGTLYAVSGWLIMNALGLDNVVGIAQKSGGDFIFVASDTIIGHNISLIFQILIITALFAAIVTFHNNVARYTFSLGRQGLIWKPLGWTLPNRQTPWVASVVQTLTIGIVVALFAAFDQDPFAGLFTWATGIGTIGVILSQLVAAIAIFVFFRKSDVDKRKWNTLVAPILAIIGLGGFFALTLDSLDILLGAQGGMAVLMLSLVFVALGGGMLYGLYLRLAAPERYDRLGHALNERELADPAPEAL
ncbi:APC family permease [Mycolicibacterium aichiense]|uniref:Amino acid permease n=3 Tax=Mycolicibacterium TaxID=1866885 RepID=A0AAD1HLM3_9MYCO|nr:APC family permease [Mycolicibacterium aichiense]MCV7018647.1 APC family permease [Mycolicibacterium aichiense]BBX07406.1 amino acid permease [Mycolicibacterium aichiense]STZ81221.1 Putative amino acid permease [Mycolicibacterium aichiense]